VATFEDEDIAKTRDVAISRDFGTSIELRT
jgi:hypothetical protein